MYLVNQYDEGTHFMYVIMRRIVYYFFYFT